MGGAHQQEGDVKRHRQWCPATCVGTNTSFQSVTKHGGERHDRNLDATGSC